MCKVTNGSGSAVEQLTLYLKFKGSKSTLLGTRREKIVSESYVKTYIRRTLYSEKIYILNALKLWTGQKYKNVFKCTDSKLT